MHKNKLNSSIIIPFYNGKGFIFDLMESLKKQTRYPDEIIIVDDGSFLEESIKILKEIKEKYRDILIINQENQGISGAMTTGAKNAIGDIIFQMDHDDLIDEEYIEKYMKIFEDNEDIDGVTSQYAGFLDGLDHTKKENIDYIYKPEGLVIPKGFFENCLGGANSAYRRTSIEKIGYWDKRFSSFQDWGMWLKFVENNLKQYIIPEVLYYYRIRNDSDLRTVAQEFDIYSEIRMSMNEIFERNSNQYNLRQIIQKMHKKYASDVKLCNDNLNQKEQLIQQKDTELNQKEQLIQQKDTELNQKEQSIQQKDTELNQKEQSIQQKDTELNQKEQSIQQKDTELNQKEQLIQQMKEKYDSLIVSKSFLIGNLFFRSIKKPYKLLTFPINFFKLITNNKKEQSSQQNERIDNIYTIEDLIYKNITHEIYPISWIPVSRDTLRLNVVTDSISKESLFGGVATALILATLFSNKYNIPIRIITRSKRIDPQDFIIFLDMMKLKLPRDIEFFSDYDRNIKDVKEKLEISDKDIFMATSWWSAQVINNINQRNIFFYILQEVEAMFYPNGDYQVMCEKMLKQDNIKYLLNTKLLSDYYEKQSDISVYKNSSFFEPTFPSYMYYPSENQFIKKYKKTLFFYARPNNSRNLYYTGLQIINNAIKENIIDTNEWNIYFAGSEYEEIFKFVDGSRPIFLGLLSWQEYLEFVRSVDLGICLMHTPHPSYPPLDIVASGGVVLTNKYKNKQTLKMYSENIIVSDLDDESMMINLQKAITLSKEISKREENYRNNNIKKDWNDSFEEMLEFMYKYK